MHEINEKIKWGFESPAADFVFLTFLFWSGKPIIFIP